MNSTTIATYFRVIDGVRMRYADNKADADTTMLLLAPWPESLWAFRGIWDTSGDPRQGGRHRHARLRPLRWST